LTRLPVAAPSHAGEPAGIIQKLSKLLVAGGKTEKYCSSLKSFGSPSTDTAMTFEETQKLYKDEAPVCLRR